MLEKAMKEAAELRGTSNATQAQNQELLARLAESAKTKGDEKKR